VSLTTHELGFESLDEVKAADALCVFVAEDERPLEGAAGFADWRLCGGLSRALRGGFFIGAQDDCLLMPSRGRIAMRRIFVIGIGLARELDADRLGRALARAARVLRLAKVEGVALDVPGARTLAESTRAAALLNQFIPEFRGGHVAVLSDKGLLRLLSGSMRSGNSG
jgi:hypothetical protein